MDTAPGRIRFGNDATPTIHRLRVAVMLTRSRTQWLGALELRHDSYALPLEVRVRALDAAARVTLHCTTASDPPRQLEMTVDAAPVGPYANNTRWCASVDPALRIARAARRRGGRGWRGDFVELAFTVRTEIGCSRPRPTPPRDE